MNYILNYRFLIRFLFIFILLILFIPSNFSIAESNHWDSEWSYFQEIIIPFDTSLEISHFQPIDIKIDFQNPCWAKNEIEHSIRVVSWDGIYWNELECQIYSLEFSKENTLSSCNLVFLIPDSANGKEKYYVYYDDSEKSAPTYIDHLEIEDLYYHYEPIPGYPLESYYYKITDDGYIPYVVSYQGQLMGYNTGQHVTKMKEETVEVLPKNGEIFAAFDFKYTYEKSLFGYSSTSQKEISHEVIVDGNLMLEFRIISTSKFDDLKTTGIYKYYHCPSNNKRVHAHIKHETLKEIDVCNIPPATNTDGVFASLQSGGVKSRSISELNIGEILPFMHFSNEVGTITEYEIDIDPVYISDEDPETRVISYYDDVHLGKNAWLSYDYGETGQSYSVIFDSNSVLVSGTDEKDGLQLNLFEVDYPHMPGFENNVATVQVGRNSFEPGGDHDLTIPNDFSVEFDAEFFCSKTGGYKIVDKEAEIFRELVKLKPQSQGEEVEDSDEVERFDLSVLVHLAPSTPIGSSLSALLGFNLSYISVELYKDDEYIYSRTAVRLPLNPLPETGDLNFIEKIIQTFKIFDLKNISIFKKAIFPDLEAGKYVIKIYRENPLFSKEKQYIGYSIVNLEHDEKINILCNSEASISIKIADQNDEIVKNAVVVLQKDNTNISKAITDEKGKGILKAPRNSEKYDLKVFYNGEVIYNEKIKLGLVQKIFPPEKLINIQRYTLELKVTDTWGQAPAVEINPIIVFDTTNNPTRIYGQKISNDKYTFTNLTPNSYKLSFGYKSFNIVNDIELSDNKELNLEFPAEFNVEFNVFDSFGMPHENSKIVVKRNNERQEIQNQGSESAIKIPPGEYELEVYIDNDLVEIRNIAVYGEQRYDLITKYQPNYLTILIIVSLLVIVFSSIFSYYKKDIRYFFVILIISLITISLFLPWWEINGTSDLVKTSTKLYIIPNNMITISSTSDTIAGEPSYIPEEFQLAISLMILFSIGGCLLLLINQSLKNKKRLIQISKILIILSSTGSLVIFTIAMNELSRITVGKLFGSGYLDIGVPGEGEIYSVLCNWGFSIGFYIYILAVVSLLIKISIDHFTKRDDETIKDKKQAKNTFNIQHPLFGISVRNWFKLLEKNKGVDLRYFARGAFITFGSILTAPTRMLFKWKYEKKINDLKIETPPVIIIGHWRSGTTYLHELLSEDPQFCYVSLWNTLLPDSFLILEPIKKFLSNFLPKKRPMDDIKVDIDGPYEEEAGMAVLTPWSFFHCFHFAKNAEEQYLKSIHFDKMKPDEKEEWKNNFEKFMKTVIYANNENRLLLKNPANTARIKMLLEIFPNAKFIHIYRDPIKVYLSTIKTRKRVLDKLALQDANEEELEKQVIENYKRLMNSFFEQKKLIPKDNIVEVKYEDLVKDPLKQIKKIYRTLKLPGLKNALPGMKQYLNRQKDYKVDVYKFDEKIINHVKENWSFTFDIWGYKSPR